MLIDDSMKGVRKEPSEATTRADQRSASFETYCSLSAFISTDSYCISIPGANQAAPGRLNPNKDIEKQASGRQPRRAAFWKAQHIDRYVSIYKSRTTPDHGLRRSFSSGFT
jgi:hypothetical protein